MKAVQQIVSLLLVFTLTLGIAPMAAMAKEPGSAVQKAEIDSLGASENDRIADTEDSLGASDLHTARTFAALQQIPEGWEELTFTNDRWTSVLVDGENVERNEDGKAYNGFRGFGAVTCNNTSNLLMDYKYENPESYEKMLTLLFDQEKGAGLNHIKVELGADTNTSSGTEPATKRTQTEPANVLRGMGWHLVADAKKINPDITVEALRWAEPSWTKNDWNLRYQWYKETIDAAYDTFGFAMDYLSPSQNEIRHNHEGELDWIVYCAKRLEEDASKPDARYDYRNIKIVAMDTHSGGNNVAAMIIKDEERIQYIDAIGYHYNLYGGEALTKANKEYGMEILYSEAIAPMINAEDRIVFAPETGGTGGTGSAADIAERFTAIYNFDKNNPAHMTHFLFQPAIGAMYEGTQYAPKDLIRASDPWSGYYRADAGLVAVRHFMQFIDDGWEYIENACYSDGSYSDGGMAYNTSNDVYLTLRSPKEESETQPSKARLGFSDDFTQVYSNNTTKERYYEVKVANLGDADQPLFLWETKGPDDATLDRYDQNYFQPIGYVTPHTTETIDETEYSVYRIKVNSHSILTVSTLSNGIFGTTEAYRPGEYDSPVEDTVLSLPYSDDFSYEDYPALTIGDTSYSYHEYRSGMPRYTADQRGAFEVRQLEDGNYVMEQVITGDLRGYEWNVWGDGNQAWQTSSAPITALGDFSWTNYKASIDFTLDTIIYDNTLPNFASIGVRQQKTGGEDLGAYTVRVYQNGKWEIRKQDSAVTTGFLYGFDDSIPHTLSLEAKENIFTAFLDGEELGSFIDTSNQSMAGRVVVSSGYHNTQFDNLLIEPIDGYSWHSIVLDDTDKRVQYQGDYSNTGTGAEGFDYLNRTAHRIKTGGSFTLTDVDCSGLYLAGATGSATIQIEVDGEVLAANQAIGGTSHRCTSYWLSGLEQDTHTITVTVLSGTLTLDMINLLQGGTPAPIVDITLTETVPTQVIFSSELPTLPQTLDGQKEDGSPVAVEMAWDVDTQIIKESAYDIITIQGQAVEYPQLLAQAKVQVIPNGLHYFIDANGVASGLGSNQAALGFESPVYRMIADYTNSKGQPLKNLVADQAKTAALPWGHFGTKSINFKGVATQGIENYDKTITTGMYGANSKNETIGYQLTLPAGSYDVTFAGYEWWSAKAGRQVDVYTKTSDERIKVLNYNYSANHQQHTIPLTVTQEEVVELQFVNLTGESPLLSWIAVAESGTESGLRAELKALLDHVQTLNKSSYTDDSWSALQTVSKQGNTVYENSQSTDEQLTQAIDNINEALTALKERAIHQKDDYRIATFAGQIPQLPDSVELLDTQGEASVVAVQWNDYYLTADTFNTPYSEVLVTGVSDSNVLVKLMVEVVPENLLYFIDTNGTVEALGKVSPSYQVVWDLLQDHSQELLNTLPDQLLDEGLSWGHFGSPQRHYKQPNTGDYSKTTTTGLYGANSEGAIGYTLAVPAAGKYELTFSGHEWWYAYKGRKVEATLQINDQAEESMLHYDHGYPSPERSLVFTTTQADSTVTLRLKPTNNESPMLSWVALRELPQREELEQLYESLRELTDEKYTDTSYQIFATARSHAADVLANSQSTVQDIKQAYDQLHGAHQGLVLTQLLGISVTALPSKTVYQLEETFDSTGLAVSAVYQDKADVPLAANQYTLSGFDPFSSGIQDILVTYQKEGTEYTTTFPVEVLAPEAPTVERLTFTPPTTLEYTIGDALVLDGMVLTAHYSDGSTRNISTGYFVSGYDKNTLGEQTISVSYQGLSVTFKVTVVAPAIVPVGISATRLPDKTRYTVGETFQPAGMEVFVYYSDNSSVSVPLSQLEYRYHFNTLGRAPVEILYQDMSTSLEVTVISTSTTPPSSTETIRPSGTSRKEKQGIDHPVQTAAAYKTLTAKAAGNRIDAVAQELAQKTTASLTFRNYARIEDEALVLLRKEKQALGLETLTLHFDQVLHGKVLHRMSLPLTDKALPSSVVIRTNKKVMELFAKYFNTPVTAISTTATAMETPVTLITKLPKNIAQENIMVYRYTQETNTYRQATTTDLHVDANGYLHFTVSQGGTFVIAEGPLSSK